MVLSRSASPSPPPALKLRISTRTSGMVVARRVRPASTASGAGLYLRLGGRGGEREREVRAWKRWYGPEIPVADTSWLVDIPISM